MVLPRQTFVLESDIKANQLIDTHPKAGTRLQKLVDKKVIDTLFVQNLVVPALSTSKRLDLSLINYDPAIPPDGLGILDQRHSVYAVGTELAILDGLHQKITAQLVYTAPVSNFGLNLVTTTNQGITVGDPGDVAIGDYIQVQNQGLVGTFLTQITNKTVLGPNYTLTFLNNFVQGPSGTYLADRVGRWNAQFRDGLGNLWPMPGDNVDLGIFYRQYLADAFEGYGRDLLYPQFNPQGGGSGSLYGAFVRLELILDPDEVFVWYHGLNTDIPVFTWWVEWPGAYPVPPIRFYYGLQGEWPEALPTVVQAPVDCKHLDVNNIEFHNRNTIPHRIKAIVLRPD